MATGMAIMGFGGAAMIAAPLSVWLMSVFSTPEHIGVVETFIVLGLVYTCFMLVVGCTNRRADSLRFRSGSRPCYR